MAYVIERGRTLSPAHGWLGGRPPIAVSDWPYGPASEKHPSRPLHHVATLDLGAVADDRRPEGFPSSGWLSFFLDTYLDGRAPELGYPAAVLHANSRHDTCTPPSDIEPVGAQPSNGDTTADAPHGLFEQMPFRLAQGDDLRQTFTSLKTAQERPLIDARTGRPTPAAAAFAIKWLSGATAERMQADIDGRAKATAQMEARLATLEKRDADARSWWRRTLLGAKPVKGIEWAELRRLRENKTWRAAHPPGPTKPPITDRDVAVKRLEVLAQQIGPALAEADANWLMDLVNGPNAFVFHISPGMLEIGPLLPLTATVAQEGPHLVLAQSLDGKTARASRGATVPLLRLSSDLALNWMWGDVGHIVFSIPRAALLKNDWSAVSLTLHSG